MTRATLSPPAFRAALMSVLGALLAGCWTYVSDLDLVADAAAAAPVMPTGVYCPVQIWSEFTEIEYSSCDRVAWDESRARHYVTPARVQWDLALGRPVPAPMLDGFGAASTWIDAAETARGLVILQRATEAGERLPNGMAAPGGYVVVVASAGPSGFAVLPRPSAAAFETLAASGGVGLAPLEHEAEDGVRIASGEAVEARALVADAAATWIDVWRAAGRDFRQRPAESADIGPLYYVRLDGIDRELPFEIAVEAAMFRIEQQVRSAAAAP
jgi:hypothetical protein